MKVLLLNTSERTGGAAVASNRLMRALQKQGIEVKMLVRDKQSQNKDIDSINTNWIMRYLNRFRFYWERLIIFLANHFHKEELFRVSIANTGADISRHPWVQEADIIHLHWINQGFLSLKDIQKLSLLDKPIVWTMHDMWPCTGICHHARECIFYHTLCKQCFYLQSHNVDLSTKVYQKKLQIYKPANITFVGCSHWLANRTSQSQLVKGKNILSIPNPISTTSFYSQNQTDSRRLFNLPTNKKLILFGALNVTDVRKGVNYLLKALTLMPINDIELVVFGQVKNDIKHLVPISIHSMGYLTDEKKIATLYNAVDLFVTSSLDENLPNTIMEAMACGTPCVGFATGGIPEMIDHLQNGYVAEYKSAEDLANGIRWVLEHPDKESLSKACVEKVKRCYAEEIVAKQYIHLYEDIL